MRRLCSGLSLLLCLFIESPVAGATVTFAAPALDRWMYPFNGTPGTRTLAPTFGNVGADLDPDFDQRDGQFLIGFQTTAGAQPVPTGLGTSMYSIQAATLTVTIGGGTFSYDPTYDSYRSYLPPSSSNYLADTDAGRPVELHGVGFRDGYTSLSFGANDDAPPGFEESTFFSDGDGFGARTRSAFAASWNAANQFVDVSNNVGDGFDPVRFAVGTTTLSAGAGVPVGTRMTFAIDVNQPLVRSYLQQSLNVGVLGLAISSLHPAEFGGLPTYPLFTTRENTSGGVLPPQLSLTYTIGGCSNRRPGDFNCDRVVSAADYVIWRTNYGLHNGTASAEQGDANGDGRVTAADYTLWANNFGLLGATLPVPEPSTYSLVLLGAAALMATTRRRGQR